MRTFTFMFMLLLFFIGFGRIAAQVAINKDGADPDPSAILDVKSTEKGFLLPRLTTIAIMNILDPATGLLVFNTDSTEFYFYDGVSWVGLYKRSDTLHWQCGCPVKYSGKHYHTVLIGTQCWFVENLDVGIRVDALENQTDNDTVEKYCYDNLDDNCEVYGGVYQWNEAMQYVTTAGARGICPEGWHLPSQTDWNALASFLGGESAAGGKLKETGLAHWASPNTGATNSSGFTALPGGYRGTAGNFSSLTSHGYFWTSDQDDATYAFRRVLWSGNAVISSGKNGKVWGLSCRCLKD